MLSAARLPQVRAEACISLQASWEQVNSSNSPNHVRRTKSSIKKRIIVCRTVRSMFGEQTFAQLRTGLTLSHPHFISYGWSPFFVNVAGSVKLQLHQFAMRVRIEGRYRLKIGVNNDYFILLSDALNREQEHRCYDNKTNGATNINLKNIIKIENEALLLLT